MAVELAKVSAGRREKVFVTTNALLRALIDGNPETIAEASAEWEKILADESFLKD